MTRNKLLNVAIVICKTIRAFYILIFVLLTFFFIHFQISPDSYKNVSFDYETSRFHMSSKKQWKANNKDGSIPKDNNVFQLAKISKPSLYFNYLQLSLIFLFTFLSIKEFQKIIASVRHLKTFKTNNATSFRTIGKYIFIIFLLTSFKNIQFFQGGKSEIHLSVTPLLFMLTAFILAEIFKEGNSLQQENDLTI